MVIMLLHIYSDGASRSNPGKSASGYHIHDEKDKLLAKDSFYNGIRTNNEAEYLGAIAGLEKAGIAYGVEQDVELVSDSELMISQMNGRYKVKKAELKELNKKAMELLKKFNAYALQNVPREERH